MTRSISVHRWLLIPVFQADKLLRGFRKRNSVYSKPQYIISFCFFYFLFFIFIYLFFLIQRWLYFSDSVNTATTEDSIVTKQKLSSTCQLNVITSLSGSEWITASASRVVAATEPAWVPTAGQDTGQRESTATSNSNTYPSATEHEVKEICRQLLRPN
jgi:hypothetical protein